MSRSLTRRGFLAGLGAGAALLPMLNPVRAGRRAAGVPKRLIIMASPNGYTSDYFPSGGELDWQISDAADAPLRPLIPYRDDILLLGGIDIANGRDTVSEWKASRGEQGSLGGHAALPFVLTGARGVPGPRISDGIEMSSGHPSIDQYLAQSLPEIAALPFGSLVLRPLRLNGNDIYLSFSGPVPGRQHAQRAGAAG